jgi:Spy/CpxP family protein refolding chaperone
MKKWLPFILVGVLCIGSTVGFAEGHRGPKPALPLVFNIEKYKEKLGLSETQITKIDAINRAHKARRDEGREKMKPLLDQIHALSEPAEPDYGRIEAIMKDLSPHVIAAQLDRIRHQKEIQAVLTPQQADMVKHLRQETVKHGHPRK